MVFRKPEARVPAGLAFLPGWYFCRVEIKEKGRGGYLDFWICLRMLEKYSGVMPR